jgi:outer membrane protein OmpA-like peptidoglycan-associated protein
VLPFNVRHLGWWLLGLLCLIGALLLWHSRPANHVTAPSITTPSIAPLYPRADKISLSGDEFTNYLAQPNASVPKRFYVDGLNFETSSAALSGTEPESLKAIATTLLAHPSAEVRVEGYTDNVGGADFNRTLSEQRAQWVRRALIDRGVGPERLTAIGYGMDRPVASNDTEDGRAMNRRVELVLTKP